MRFYLSFTLFGLIILLYWVFTELFTILFRFTGLPEEKARFQVVSLLTGCGFTTRESEMVVSNRRRRRLARITMLFGYVFNISIVSVLVNVLLSLSVTEEEHTVLGLLIPMASVAVIFVVMRIEPVRIWSGRRLERFASRIVRGDTGNSVTLLDYIGDDTIALVTLHSVPAALRDKNLAELGLRASTGIFVMLVEHKGEKAVAAQADMVFREEDMLTVFGPYAAIRETFEAREHFDR